MAHYHVGGGAAKYINGLRSFLNSRKLSTIVVGAYGRSYNLNENNRKEKVLEHIVFNLMSKFIFPCYAGVTVRAKVFYFLLMILKLPIVYFFSCLLKAFRSNDTNDDEHDFDVVVLTSGIQAPVLMFKPFFKKTKFVILNQENTIFNGISGRLSIWLFKKSDVIISITKDWLEYAKEKNLIQTILVPNVYERPNLDIQDKNESFKYHGVYLGGGGNIKGFSFICDELESIKHGAFSFCFLGCYTERQVAKLREIEKKSSYVTIEIKGVVAQPYKYILRSLVVLLPITSSHFCRPAIEAGLCRKTFIITDLPGLDDFAIENYNCLKFSPSLGSLIKKIELLILDEKLRCELSNNNFVFSNDIHNKSWDLYQEFFNCLVK
ncbi:glycosyltransferase [Aeromonas veronii]|uniref:glycosyltransferase n=1 Tax=Aeromonas veronii TaxID=654 RepID=UPI003D1A51D7